MKYHNFIVTAIILINTILYAQNIPEGFTKLNADGNGAIYQNNITNKLFTTNTLNNTKINSLPKSDNYFVTTIEYDTINFANYEGIYSIFQAMPLGGFNPPVFYKNPVTDKTELYAAGLESNEPDPHSEGHIYEFNGSFLEKIYEYNDDLNHIWGISDLDNDGTDDLVTASRFPKIFVYTKDSSSTILTQPKTSFSYSEDHNGCYSPKFVDYDNDGNTEIIFYYGGDSIYRQGVHILEFDSLNNTFNLEFYNETGNENCYDFTIGDIDNDGLNNITYTTIYGNLYIMELQNDGSFKYDTLSFERNNCTLHKLTDDFNNNGKPELWIGGYIFLMANGAHKIWCVESTGNDQYEVIGEINLVNFTSFFNFYGDYIDIDNDNIKEFVILLDQGIMILEPNNNSFRMQEFIKIPTHHNANLISYAIALFDINDNHYPEISLTGNSSDGGTVLTLILKRDKVSSVEQTRITPASYSLSQNYPNPFNPSTTISYSLPENANVKLIVYDMLGREVATLVNETKEAGKYSVNFEASNLASGMYIYRLQAGNFTKTNKMTLLK